MNKHGDNQTNLKIDAKDRINGFATQGAWLFLQLEKLTTTGASTQVSARNDGMRAFVVTANDAKRFVVLFTLRVG
jgi:hypothetical protein